MKKLSPPSTERLSPRRRPPALLALVSTLSDGLIATMAPASVRTDSPGSSVTVASAYACPYSMLCSTASLPCRRSTRRYPQPFGGDRLEHVETRGARIERRPAP